MTGMLVWVWACFWPCHGFLMKKCPEWKFFIFESRTFWNKFHFIWVKETQDIACLVHIGLFWTDSKEAFNACVKWINLRKWWTWKLAIIGWSSYDFKFHALCINYAQVMCVRSGKRICPVFGIMDFWDWFGNWSWTWFLSMNCC